MSTRIIVDEEEPLDDNDELQFTSADVQVRKDRWVTDEFEIMGFLGRGKFGEVKRCCELSSGREFAAKFISAPRPQDKKDVEHEINIMRQLKHKRIIQLYNAYECKTEMCLILEIIYGGELFDRVISEDFLLTEKACMCFIRQICEGIEYMHACNIIHLDMKPENILCLSQTGNRIKIIDFGLAREWNPKKDLRVLFGTPEFMAPEVVQYEPITFATDMWSVGVICYVLLSGLSPFMGDSDADTLQNVIEGDYDFDYPEFEEVSADAKNLVAKLLVKDKKKRLTARECLEHPWLQRKVQPPQSPTLDLSKKRLKTFVYRRKWQKIVNAIIALKRMGVQLPALKKSSLDMLEPGASVIHPDIMASHLEAVKLAESSKVTEETVEDTTQEAGSGSSSGTGFFNFRRKKSTKSSAQEGKEGNATGSSGKADLPPPCKPKPKGKNKESSAGGFFGKLKKQKDTNKDQTNMAKSKDKVENAPVVKNSSVPNIKEKNDMKAMANTVDKLSPTEKPVPPAKPNVADKVWKPNKPLTRDSSVRRSTKLSKQGLKGEQYISLEKAATKAAHQRAAKEANSTTDGIMVNNSSPPFEKAANDVKACNSDVPNDISASTSNLANDVNGDNDTARPSRAGPRLPGAFGTFSRVRDRIKFLEQKDNSNTDTIRRKKGKLQQDHGRAS